MFTELRKMLTEIKFIKA